MIRPEDVRRAAIEAAIQAFEDREGTMVGRNVMEAAIDAYERAMWQPVQRDNPPLGNVLVGVPNAEPGFRGRAYHLGAASLLPAQWMPGSRQTPPMWCGCRLRARGNSAGLPPAAGRASPVWL